MDYNEIKQIIDDNIKPNTSQDITAIVANLVMTGMIDYTRDSIIDIVNQGFGTGAFTWLDVEHGAVIPYPQMSAGRARVVRIFKDNVEYEDGEATIGGVNGITIKRHALVICLEATNEMANDGMQETVGDRFAVIQSDDEIIFSLEVTKTELDNLIANEELIPNALYKITGVNPELYGGTDIYLTAISSTELNPNGVGKFYNPKYDKGVPGFGLVKDYVWWESPEKQKESGVYAVNDVVIWGGKHWVCVQETSINTKYIINDFELDTNYFEVVPFNDDDYNIAFDAIKYDYDNDWIIERNERGINIVSFSYDWLVYFTIFLGGSVDYINPIRGFMWGNIYEGREGIGFQRITNSLNRNINFRGSSQYNLTFDNGSSQYNLTFDNYSRQNNLTFDSGSSQSNLTFDNGSSQYNLTFDSGSSQYNLTTSGSNRRQEHLTFNSFQSNRTGQPLSSNETNLTFDNTVQNLPQYGQGNITGTPTYILGVTADGKVVETDLLQSITGYDAGATQTLKNVNGVLTWVTD